MKAFKKNVSQAPLYERLGVYQRVMSYELLMVNEITYCLHTRSGGIIDDGSKSLP